MGYGVADVGEDADVSHDVGLCGVGEDGGVVERLNGCCVTDSPRFVESCGKTSQAVSHSFSISAAMCFWST